MLTATAAVAILASGAMAEDAPRKGGTLITVMATNVRNLNPAVQSGIVTGYPGAQLFAAPLRYDEDWTPQPYLAKSWDVSEDGLTVTLNLVDNAVFHDGAPITSEDVAFSVDTIKAHAHADHGIFPSVANLAVFDGLGGALRSLAADDHLCHRYRQLDRRGSDHALRISAHPRAGICYGLAGLGRV